MHFNQIDGNPFAAVEQCERDAYYVIMSHSHELDFELAEAVLTRGDAAYCGLIASSSKARSFKGRLARKGFSKSELQQLTAPLGQSIETGNLPMEVAVAAMADILTARQRNIKPAQCE
jgi:xanthine dehydrogenase accessory factor